jgi:hypothetical protein
MACPSIPSLSEQRFSSCVIGRSNGVVIEDVPMILRLFRPGVSPLSIDKSASALLLSWDTSAGRLDKPPWMCADLQITAVARWLAAANILVSINELILMHVQMLKKDELGLYPGSEIIILVTVFEVSEDLKLFIHGL